MAAGRAPYLPVRWVVRLRFESVRKMPRVTCPSLIIHSHGDELIPHVMAERLADAAGGPVTRLDLADAGHHRLELLQVAETELVPAVRKFLRAAGVSAE